MTSVPIATCEDVGHGHVLGDGRTQERQGRVNGSHVILDLINKSREGVLLVERHAAGDGIALDAWVGGLVDVH